MNYTDQWPTLNVTLHLVSDVVRQQTLLDQSHSRVVAADRLLNGWQHGRLRDAEMGRNPGWHPKSRRADALEAVFKKQSGAEALVRDCDAGLAAIWTQHQEAIAQRAPLLSWLTKVPCFEDVVQGTRLDRWGGGDAEPARFALPCRWLAHRDEADDGGGDQGLLAFLERINERLWHGGMDGNSEQGMGVLAQLWRIGKEHPVLMRVKQSTDPTFLVEEIAAQCRRLGNRRVGFVSPRLELPLLPKSPVDAWYEDPALATAKSDWLVLLDYDTAHETPTAMLRVLWPLDRVRWHPNRYDAVEDEARPGWIFAGTSQLLTPSFNLAVCVKRG